MTKKQFTEITEWQNETFPKATTLSKITHLEQEIEELKLDVEGHQRTGTGAPELEFADCFLLLFGAAAKHGMTYEGICNAIDYKMKINRNRTWGKPDANGVVNHIK